MASLALAGAYIKTEKYTDALGTAKSLLNAKPTNGYAAAYAGFASMKLSRNDVWVLCDVVSKFHVESCTLRKVTMKTRWSKITFSVHPQSG